MGAISLPPLCYGMLRIRGLQQVSIGLDQSNFSLRLSAFSAPSAMRLTLGLIFLCALSALCGAMLLVAGAGVCLKKETARR